MIKQLKIRNLVLVQEAEIIFEKGLNVLTGETGAGKSAVLHALALIRGDKSDATILRKGADKGTVEALFSIEHAPHIQHLLDEAGVDPLDPENPHAELLLKREIHSNGRSRAFINNQIAQVSLLEKLGELLFEIIGQHANQSLKSPDQHRQLLDLYGELTPLYLRYRESWQEKSRLTQELHLLTSRESERIRMIEICEREIEEIEEAKLQEEEDDTLFQEYTLLCSAEERASKLDELLQILQGERNAILPQLRRAEHLAKELYEMDRELEEVEAIFKNAFIEIEEAFYTLRNYRHHIDINPERTEKIDERLTLINKLKRKYGTSIEEILRYQTEQQEKLNELKNSDQKIAETRKLLEEQNALLVKWGEELSSARLEAAKSMEQALTEQLRQLNMPKALFKVDMTPQSPGPHGNEKVEFFLAPNAGEKCLPIRECASGGELSRVLLALKVLLTGKALIPTIIFDEIDSNIGGATAVVIGQKLKEIGKSHQVFCITHFAQVAKLGEHHLRIRKEEQEGRTFTFIETLNMQARKQEFERMLGNIC